MNSEKSPKVRQRWTDTLKSGLRKCAQRTKLAISENIGKFGLAVIEATDTPNGQQFLRRKIRI